MIKSLIQLLTFFFGIFLLSEHLSAQENNATKRTWADSTVVRITSSNDIKNEDAIELLDSAYHIYAQELDTCMIIKTRTLQSGYLDGLGKSDIAINHLLSCLKYFQPSCDSMLLMEIYLNLSSTYLSLGDFEKVDEVCMHGLENWNPRWPSNKQNLGLLNNQGIALASMGNFEEADHIFRRLLSEAMENKEQGITEQTLINIGTIFGIENELDSAYYYYNSALAIMGDETMTNARLDLKINLGVLQQRRKKYKAALQILKEVYLEADSRSDLQHKAMAAVEIASTYNLAGEKDSAYLHLSNYIQLKDSLLTQERVQSVAEMQEKYESVKKAKEIDELKLKNLDAELTNERVKRTRNAMYAGAGLLIISLWFLFFRYRTMHRNRNELLSKNIIISEEKKRSDDLLRNILPDEVAEELKAHGKARAQGFDVVTILFSDFKGFTQISERLTPAELVGELDICFQAFDHIITKYKLEKIKTIGDAYMAVGGLPDRTQHNAINIVLAALDMQDFMINRKKELIEKGWLAFDMRIGLHSGPVVAGVVGVKKFQYDVWGDSVNIAARMESSGEIRKVNISETTHALVKDSSLLSFEYRGKIEAKNKGHMDMYYVNSVSPL